MQSNCFNLKMRIILGVCGAIDIVDFSNGEIDFRMLSNFFNVCGSCSITFLGEFRILDTVASKKCLL